MANPHKFYMMHLHAKTGYRATWDPGRPLKLGQIGKLDRFGAFTVFSSLEKEGINTEVYEDTTGSDKDYTSHDQVSISIKASGQAPAIGSLLTNADAGFNIEFKSEKGIVFQTTAQKTHQITNLGEIEAQILQKFHSGNWEKDWLIITQLVEAETGTIIISNSSNGKLELKAKANAGTQNLKLTDASLGLTVAREQGSTLKYIAQSGLTPLYKVMGLRHPLFKAWELGNRTDKEELLREELRIQEFIPEEVEVPAEVEN